MGFLRCSGADARGLVIADSREQAREKLERKHGKDAAGSMAVWP